MCNLINTHTHTHLRQEVAPESSRQLWAQAPTRRCAIEGRTAHQGREQGKRDKNRDGGGTRARTSTGMGTRMRAGSQTRVEQIMDGRESLGSGNRGGSEAAREGATSISNQPPQSQDPTPQRNRPVTRKTRDQGREARNGIGKGGGEAKKRKKPQESCRSFVKSGGRSSGRRENVEKKE